MTSADLGPVQFIAVRFGPDAEFEGLVLDELERLSARGVIRVLDLQFLRRTPDGALEGVELAELDPGEPGEVVFGTAVAALLGAGAGEISIAPEAAELGDVLGMSAVDAAAATEGVAVGDLVGVLLVEHVWAAELRDAIRLTGGTPLAQGFLTPEAVFMIGAELEAMAEAEAAVELADAIRGAAMLDALASLEAAEQVRAAAAAEAVSALITAGLVADAAAEEAAEVLVLAGLVEEAALEEAAAVASAAMDDTAAALAAMATAAE